MAPETILYSCVMAFLSPFSTVVRRNMSAQTGEDNTLLLRVNGSDFRRIAYRRQVSTVRKKGMNIVIQNGTESPESSPPPVARVLSKQDSRRFIAAAPAERKASPKIATIAEEEEMVFSRESVEGTDDTDGSLFTRWVIELQL